MVVGWSSLPLDLIRCVADCFLATNDIDCYMNMRAVCCNWRAATDDPCRRGTDLDILLFRPRQWIMLDADSEHEDHLFVNVSTGRFLRRRLPMLREHVMVNASDGLIILVEIKRPHAVRVLNPLTGSLIHFAMPIPDRYILMSVVTGSDPTLVFCTFSDNDREALWCADPTSKSISVPLFCSGPIYIDSMVPYAGNVYAVDLEGSLFKIVVTSQHCYSEQMAKISNASRFFLVESAGELLLIRRLHREAFEIFQVDLERKVVQAVKSIGSRALILGHRSMSVDADKLPSIYGNCLYYQVGGRCLPGLYMYDLRDGKASRISETLVTHSLTESFSVPPRSLVQVLLGHCSWVPDVKPQLRRLQRTRED